MIYLIWSLINGVVFLYFLYLIVGFIAKGKRIFKPQFKVVSIFIIAIGIVQIISASGLEENTNQIMITNSYDKNHHSEVKKVTLKNHLTFAIHMYVKYTIDQNEYIPIEANSFLTGFANGYAWEFESIQTKNHKKNEPTQFTAQGNLKWNLFGITVYTESRSFRGVIH